MYIVTQDTAVEEAFEISLQEEKPSILNQLQEKAQERIERRKSSLVKLKSINNIEESKEAKNDFESPKSSMEKLYKSTKASLSKISPPRTQGQQKRAKLFESSTSNEPISNRTAPNINNEQKESSLEKILETKLVVETDRICRALSKQRLQRVHRQMLEDRQRDLNDLGDDIEASPVFPFPFDEQHIDDTQQQQQEQEEPQRCSFPVNEQNTRLDCKKDFEVKSSGSESTAPTLTDSLSDCSSVDLETDETPEALTKEESFSSLPSVSSEPWRISCSSKYTFKTIPHLNAELLNIEKACSDFDEGLIDESAFAIEVITALFLQDFRRKKNWKKWKICGATIVSKENCSDDSVATYNAEKKANLEWKNVYCMASAKGRISFVLEGRQIKVEEYNFCVANRRFHFIQ